MCIGYGVHANTTGASIVSFGLVLSNQHLLSSLLGAFFASKLHITSNFHNIFRLAYSMRARNHYILNCEWNIYVFSSSFITSSTGKRNGEWNVKKERKWTMECFFFLSLLIVIQCVAPKPNWNLKRSGHLIYTLLALLASFWSLSGLFVPFHFISRRYVLDFWGL